MNEETTSNKKKITVLNPIQKKWVFNLFTNEQMFAFAIGIGITMYLVNMAEDLTYPIDVIVRLIAIPIWIIIAWYNRSHKSLMKAAYLTKHRTEKLIGETKYLKFTDKEQKLLRLLGIYDIKSDGAICFSKLKDKWGYIIPCLTNTTNDDERLDRIHKIRKLHDSFPPNTEVLFNTKSQIIPINAVEAMITKNATTKRTKQESELLLSMLEKSRNTKKTIEWSQTLCIFIECKEEEIDSFAQSLLPGVLDALKSTNVMAYVLTHPEDIIKAYSSDFTTIKTDIGTRSPAILEIDSFYKKIVNQVLPSKIEILDRSICVNDSEHSTCIVIGLPDGGVSGIPSDLNFGFIEKLYALSASESQTIKMSLRYVSTDKTEALTSLTQYIDEIEVKKAHAIKHNQVAENDKLDHEKEKWERIMKLIMDGDINMYIGTFIITITAKNETDLSIGISRVEGLLNANRISHEIISGRMKEVYSWTKMMPLKYKKWMKNITPKLLSDSVTEMTPIISSLHPNCSEVGTWFGNTTNGKEIIIDESKFPAHMAVVGGTGSGKTTFLLGIGVRKYAQGNEVLYITTKAEYKGGTDFQNVAREIGEDGQIIELGPKSDPNAKVYNINILDIIYPNEKFNAEAVFHAHITILKNWFRVLFKNSVAKSDNMPIYIEKTLISLYKRFGYKPNNPKTWNPQVKPTLIDLVEIWEKDVSNKDEETNRTAKGLFDKSSLFLNTAKFLSEPTNIDFNKRFIVVDLSGLKQIDSDLLDAMNYFMTVLISNRMFTMTSHRKTLIMDEARDIFINPILSQQFVQYLTKLRSYKGEVVFSTLEVSDFEKLNQEILANTSIVMVLGNGIRWVLDSIAGKFKLSHASYDYLYNCTEPGQGILSLSSPYHQEYQIKFELTDKEKEWIFGIKNSTKEQTQDSAFCFKKSSLESFSKEQKVIMSDWIEGNVSILKDKMIVKQVQNVFGTGKVTAFIDPEIIDESNDMIWNQHTEHYTAVMQIAGFFLQRDFPASVNHNFDVDTVVTLPTDQLAIEYQTSAKNIVEKKLEAESRYGRLLFVADSSTAQEIRAVFGETKEGKEIAKQIVVARGKELLQKLNSIVEESRAESS